MNTEIIKLQKENLEDTIIRAAKIIKKGGLVIFPTETVYGIGANALDKYASEKIYKAKGRPSDNPLIVHVSSIEMLKEVVEEVNSNSKKLIENFWPGPLTLIMKKNKKVPYKTTGGLDTVAVRMPSNFFARKLIELSELPIAAPSANISGKPSITNENYLVKEFEGTVDMIILDNESEIGIESTVVEATLNNINILRPGFITSEKIKNVLNLEIKIDLNILDYNIVPRSPGMKYKHYSPKCEVTVIKGSLEEKISKTKKMLKDDTYHKIKSVVMCKTSLSKYFDSVIPLGNTDIEIAKNIFYELRKLDDDKIQKAYFIELSDTAFEFSIMDRINKAAGYKFI